MAWRYVLVRVVGVVLRVVFQPESLFVYSHISRQHTFQNWSENSGRFWVILAKKIMKIVDRTASFDKGEAAPTDATAVGLARHLYLESVRKFKVIQSDSGLFKVKKKFFNRERREIAFPFDDCRSLIWRGSRFGSSRFMLSVNYEHFTGEFAARPSRPVKVCQSLKFTLRCGSARLALEGSGRNLCNGG